MFLIDMVFNDMALITPALTEQHRAYIGAEYKNETLLFGGPKVPRTGGLILSKHESLELLTDFLEADPFVSSGAAAYSITEFKPMMGAPSFEFLLDNNTTG